MAAVTVSRSGDRLIAVKQVPAERAGEIEREADLLRRLNHPGLVRFVDIVEAPDGGRALHTEFVNSDTWATRPLTDPAERAAGMAALASVVADLHQLGVAHLQLTPAHVLHGPGDRPVLCGLTLAAEATPENRQTDLAALGDLCHDSSLGKGALAEKLSSLADEARTGMLSARELARRLDLLTAKKPPRSDPVRAAAGSRLGNLGRRLRPKSLIAAAAVAAAVVAAFALGSRSGFVPEDSEAALSDTPANTAKDEAGQGNPVDGTGLADGPTPAERAIAAGLPDAAGTMGQADSPSLADGTGQPAEPGSADHTGPGIGSSPAVHAEPDVAASPNDHAGPAAASPDPQEPVAVSEAEAAAVLDHGGRRYAVGTAGDFVETGDWNCDGQVTAAIVRPSTGGIVLFDAWPEPGQTIELPVRWSVDSPTGAEAVTHGQCDLLRVYTTTGSRLFNPGAAS